MRYIVRTASLGCRRENQPCEGCAALPFGNRILKIFQDGESRTITELVTGMEAVAQGFEGLNASITETDGRKDHEVVFHNQIRINGKPCTENGAEVTLWAGRSKEVYYA